MLQSDDGVEYEPVWHSGLWDVGSGLWAVGRGREVKDIQPHTTFIEARLGATRG
jgi:hypothetical protein